ncbi:MAG: PAS domain S-box protein [Nibricoccus sp.]
MHNPTQSLLAPTVPTPAPTSGFEDWWQRLQPILNSASDFCAVIDAEFVYRAANDNYCQAHGRPRSEIVGQNVAGLWGDNLFQSILRPPLERCFQGEEVRYEAHFGFPKTGPRHYEVSLHPYAPANGSQNLPQAIVITRDVTALHEAEEEARLVLLLARAINQAPDFDTALGQAVREICRFTGWTLGQAWLSVPGEEGFECAPFCETLRPGLEAFVALSRQKNWRQDEVLAGAAWQADQPVWAPDFADDPQHPRSPLARELGLTAAMAIPVRAGGKVVAVMEYLLATPRTRDRRLMGVVAAVTSQLDSLFQRKRVETALRDSEERYHNLVETANDVIFSLTPDGNIAALNPAFETLTGWTCTEWIGKSFFPLLHPDDLPTAQARLYATLQGAPPRRSEYRVRKADGGYAVGEFIVTPNLREGKVVGLSGIGRDITERKRAEEAMHQSEEHYRELFHQAYQMQENLRRLSDRVLRVQEQERARISRDLHDEVGQTLTAINVNLAVLGKAVASGPKEVVQRLADARALLEQTMETVHNFSRELRPAMLDDLGLVPALRSYLKSCANRTGLTVDFHASREEQIEQLAAEQKTVFYRVAQEGLNNAIKHAQANRVVVEAEENNGRVSLTIVDDGRGFVVNGQAAEEAPGRLGLLGIAERVRLVNGEFSVQSAPGQGTTLRVVVPLSAA